MTQQFRRQFDALRHIAEHRIATVGGVPTQLALMLRDPAFDACDLRCVRAIVVGGGPATPALLREARARFGAPVAVRYSCTEAGVGTGTALDETHVVAGTGKNAGRHAEAIPIEEAAVRRVPSKDVLVKSGQNAIELL